MTRVLTHFVGAERALLLAELIKYGLTSAIALAVDWGLLIVLTETAGFHYLVSGLISFCAGLVVAYALSVSFVFRSRRFPDTGFEFAIFCVLGVLGLALTQFLLWVMVEKLGVHYAVAKLPTAGVVFIFNFTTRRWVLFSRGHAAAPRTA